MPSPFLLTFMQWARGLRFPTLFKLTAALFAVNLVLPSINEVPDAFSAVVLWRFRVVSLGIHLILWTTIGLLFGYLTERSLAVQFQPQIRARTAS